jgi:two-component system sensor histidine kinase RpfC
VDASRPGSETTSFQNARGAIPTLALSADKADQTSALAADAIVTMPIVPDDLAHAALQLIARSPALAQKSADEAIATPQREMPKIEPEPLDERALDDLEKLGGHDFVRDIVAQFVGDAAVVLANLSAAVSAHDMKAFREEAHALRSCAANVGAHNVYRMCLAWRDLDSHEIAASGSQYMQMLEDEFARVRNALVPMLAPDEKAAGESSEAA